MEELTLKIGIVVWDLSVSGGTQRQAIELALELKKNHEVGVFCYAFDQNKCYPDLTKHLKIESIAKAVPKTQPRPAGKIGALLFDSYKQFHFFDAEIRQLAATIPDDLEVLNAHDLFTEQVAYYYKRRAPNSRVVWMSNDVPGIFQILDHEREQPRSPKSLLGKTSYVIQKALYALEGRRELRFTAAVDTPVVLDNRNKRQVKELIHQDAVVVRSGLDLNRFTPASSKQNPEFTILGTGIFFRHRRFEDLIQAVQILAKRGRSVHLDIIGSAQFDPAYGSELGDLVKKLDIEKQVSFLGRVTEQELMENYQQADAFVFPNHNQTWGLAVFEAMASGTPVIVSKTSGAHEVLTEGVNALLVDPLSPEQIAEKITLLMENSELRNTLVRNGRQFVQDNISWPMYAENMMKVFLHDQA